MSLLAFSALFKYLVCYPGYWSTAIINYNLTSTDVRDRAPCNLISIEYAHGIKIRFDKQINE